MQIGWNFLSVRFYWVRKNHFENSIIALWAWCIDTSKFSIYVHIIWSMQRINNFTKVKNILFSLHFNSSSINSSCFYYYYQVSILCYETDKNIMHTRMEDEFSIDHLLDYIKKNCKKFYFRDVNGWIFFYEISSSNLIWRGYPNFIFGFFSLCK